MQEVAHTMSDEFGQAQMMQRPNALSASEIAKYLKIDSHELDSHGCVAEKENFQPSAVATHVKCSLCESALKIEARFCDVISS